MGCHSGPGWEPHSQVGCTAKTLAAVREGRAFESAQSGAPDMRAHCNRVAKKRSRRGCHFRSPARTIRSSQMQGEQRETALRARKPAHRRSDKKRQFAAYQWQHSATAHRQERIIEERRRAAGARSLAQVAEDTR